MKIQIGGRTQSSGSGCGGKLIASIFGLVFLLAGLAFTFFIGREALKVIRTWTSWKAVGCEILSASASTDGDEENPYGFEVSYRYSFEGGRYTGHILRTSDRGFEDFRPVQLRLLKYVPGSRHSCFVDPVNPENAVLERRSPAFALLVFFPLIFVAIGAFVLIGTWKKGSAGTEEEELGKRGMSPRAKKRALKTLFLLILLVGLGVLYLMRGWFLGPIRAGSWLQVPARVVESHLRRHESTDSDGHTSVTWKIDILYEYEISGRHYRSNRFGFIGGSSSGRASKKDVLRTYPSGANIEVYVDPNDPTSAVIRPGWSLSHLLLLIPVVLILVGIIGLSRWTGRKTAPDLVGAEGEFSDRALGDGETAGASRGPRLLRPGGGRRTKVIVAFVIGLFWNGMISVFLYQVISGFHKGHPDWVLTIFMIPFVLAGLGIIGFFFHSILALANPKAFLTLEDASVHLGEKMTLSWEIRGSLSRLADFRILLTGRESATYRRGTNTHTDTEFFFRAPVFESSGGAILPEGRGSLEIPPDTMHSFDAPNNKIIWRLEVHAGIPRWPDVSDSWDIQILPALDEGGESWTS